MIEGRCDWGFLRMRLSAGCRICIQQPTVKTRGGSGDFRLNYTGNGKTLEVDMVMQSHYHFAFLSAIS